ncbi:unnamed protein product, partial [Tetraodon nigroviridis]
NLHQWPKQPFPVAPKHFPIPAEPLYMPGMPPGLAYNTEDHLGFMHHPYMNGIPNVLQFGVPVANHFSPGCYMPVEEELSQGTSVSIKMSAPKTIPKDAQVRIQILKDMGITEYEPRVINQMLGFTY